MFWRSLPNEAPNDARLHLGNLHGALLGGAKRGERDRARPPTRNYYLTYTWCYFLLDDTTPCEQKLVSKVPRTMLQRMI